MTNIEESSKPYFQLLTESNAGSDEISAQVLLLLRDLYAAYPDPVIEPAKAFNPPGQGLERRIINWLAAEHLLKVQDTQAWLTFTGCETVRRTCRVIPSYTTFFEDPASPPPDNATDLVLALLKTHFERGRAAGR